MKRTTFSIQVALLIVLAGFLLQPLNLGASSPYALSPVERARLASLAEASLLRGLQADDPIVRAAATWASGNAQFSLAIKPLLHALEGDPSWWVRVAAARALAELRATQAVPALAETLKQAPDTPTRKAIQNALITFGSPAIPALIDLLDVSQAEVRQAAARALGTIGQESAVPALLKALKTDSVWAVRLQAIGALGTIGSPKALPALADLVQDFSTDVLLRAEAAFALGRLQTRDAVPILLNTFKHESHKLVQLALILGLGEAGDPQAVPTLAYVFLNYGDESLQRAAAWALGQIHSPVAISILYEALTFPATEMRLAAALALGAQGDPQALPVLLEAALNDPDSANRAQIAQALETIGSKATEAVAVLVQLLFQDPYASVRRAAARALSAIGSAAAVSALLQALENDLDITVRLEAAEALGKLKANQATSALLYAFTQSATQEAGRYPILADTSTGRFAYALVEMGPSALSELVQLLEHDNQDIRRAATFAVGLFLTQELVEAVPTLEAILTDNSETPNLLQVEAACALYKILQEL